MTWAKLAAENIVSDDAIDEADAEKSSSSDWLKWALAAGILGAGGFAAWKYSPQIQKTLGNLKVFNNATPTNRATEALTFGATASPGTLGAAVGALSGSPLGALPGALTGMKKLDLTKSKLLAGINHEPQTLEGQADVLSHASPRTGRSDDPGVAHSNAIHGVWEGGGHPGVPRAWTTAGRQPGSAVAELAGAAETGLTPDQGIGAERRAAIRQTEALIQNLNRLGETVDKPVTYVDPDTKASVTKRLLDVPEAHLSALPAEHGKAWQLHNRAWQEAGVHTPFPEARPGTPGASAIPREQFDLRRQSAALSGAQRKLPELQWGHVGRNALGGALIGGLGSSIIDKGLDAAGVQ